MRKRFLISIAVVTVATSASVGGIALAATGRHAGRLRSQHLSAPALRPSSSLRSRTRAVSPAIRAHVGLFRGPALSQSTYHRAHDQAPVEPSAVSAVARMTPQAGMNPALARSAVSNGQQVSIAPAGTGACVVGPGSFACGSADAFSAPNATGLIVAGENESTPANQVDIDGAVPDGIVSVTVSTASGNATLPVVNNVYAGYVTGTTLTKAIATTNSGSQIPIYPKSS